MLHNCQIMKIYVCPLHKNMMDHIGSEHVARLTLLISQRTIIYLSIIEKSDLLF